MSDLAVIGIDPGLTTGIFEWNTARMSPDTSGWISHEISAVDVPLFLNRRLRAMSKRSDMQVHIAVEKFIINARTARLSQQSEALEVTGMVKAIAAVSQLGATGRVDVRQYLKSNLKYASDEALKRANWYSVRERHANDAARQAFALLKDVDYPLWCRVSEGAMIESDDR